MWLKIQISLIKKNASELQKFQRKCFVGCSPLDAVRVGCDCFALAVGVVIWSNVGSAPTGCQFQESIRAAKSSFQRIHSGFVERSRRLSVWVIFISSEQFDVVSGYMEYCGLCSNALQ